MFQIHQQIHVFVKLGFGHDFMTIWGFILEHGGHILGLKSASKSIPELDIYHGSPMGASGRPMGTSRGGWGTPKREGRRSLRAWDEDLPPPWSSPGGKEDGHFGLGMRILGVPTCPLDNL